MADEIFPKDRMLYMYFDISEKAKVSIKMRDEGNNTFKIIHVCPTVQDGMIGDVPTYSAPDIPDIEAFDPAGLSRQEVEGILFKIHEAFSQTQVQQC